MRVVCLSVLPFLVACPLFGGGGQGGDPCTDDAHGCGQGGALEIDEDCELIDSLDVQLGNGDGTFGVLAPGEEPELVHGLQGGFHMVLGVAVDNPSSDHLAFEVQVQLSAELDGELQDVGERAVVYEGSSLDVLGGRVEMLDLVVVPDVWPETGRRWITVHVTDACGRTGDYDHPLD